MSEAHVCQHADLLRKAVAATRQPAQLDLLGSIAASAPTLRNARLVTVEKLVRFTVPVFMRLSRRRSKQVFVGTRPVGKFDKFCNIPWSEESNPFQVQGVKLWLLDGQEFFVFSHALSVITDWNRFERTDGSRGYFPTKEIVLNTSVMLRVGVDVSPRLRVNRRLTWDVAGSIDVGQPITLEFPFQLLGDAVSNGVLRFPSAYPEPWQPEDLVDPSVPRALWHELLGADNKSIPRVTKKRYPGFRAGLCGMFLKDFIPPVPLVASARPRKTSLTNHQAEVGRVIAEAVQRPRRSGTDGTMYDGKGCTEVSFFQGQDNVMFAAHRHGKSIYFVEHAYPDHAVYVFYDEEKARLFGSGGISRSDAIAEGAERVIHAGAWQERIAHLVEAL
jgi:hypothetical protein